MKPSQRNRITCCSLTALALAGLLLWPGFAGAQKPYYQGKSLNLLVDFSAGGPTDIECRIYARHLKKHLAGDPRIIVTNRPGAGGRVAMNWFYGVAPRDGTIVGCMTAGTRYQEWFLADPEAVGLKANMAEVIPVMFTPVVSVGAIRSDVAPGIKRPEDILKAKEWFAGGFTVESNKDLKFRSLFDLVGAQYGYVTGYPGAADLLGAFQRKEIDYVDGSTPFYLSMVKPIVNDGGAVPLWYSSPKEIPEIRPGYKADDFVRKLAGKEPSGPLWQLFQMGDSYRMIMFPPKVPQEAIQAMRSAFESLAKDRAFLEEYRKIVGIPPTMLTEEKELQAAVAPWKSATKEMKEFRLRYIEQGQKLVGQGRQGAR
jgi:tripartite-type tricarboxylate transporter receptor subunit TctC